jgi:O-antigen/teichoic acid export membrane protein
MTEVRTRPAGAPRTTDAAGWILRQVREPYMKLLASQLLTGGVALIANVLMVRAMTPDHRGEVALLLQIVYLGSQVLLLGTERSFVASYHNFAPASAVRAYARLLIVPVLAGILGAAVFSIAAPHGVNPGAAIIALIVAYTLVAAVGLAARSIAIAVGKTRDFLAAQVIEALLQLALFTVLFLVGVSSPAIWILAYLLAGGLPTTAYVLIWLRGSTRGQGHEHNSLVRREGLALFPAAVSNMAMLRTDRLVLPALASTSALGLYASVATMTELLAWPLRAFADSRIGKWRAAHREGELRTRPVVLAAVAYSVVLVPLAAGCLYLLIVPLFGEAYAPAKAVVLPLVVAAGLYGISRIGLALLIAKGHAGLVSAAEIVGFVVSFTFYLLLIPAHGILGAAYGSLLGYGACLVFVLVVMRVKRDRTP